MTGRIMRLRYCQSKGCRARGTRQATNKSGEPLNFFCAHHYAAWAQLVVDLEKDQVEMRSEAVRYAAKSVPLFPRAEIERGAEPGGEA